MTVSAHLPVPQPDRFRRFGFAAGLILLALLAAFVLLPASVDAKSQNAPAHLLGTSVVISEFRTNGPNGGNDEFIEIFNPTQSDINISGWKIRRSPATGSTLYDQVVFPNPTIIQKGQYLLIVNNATGGYSGSVPGDFVYNTGFADGGGIAITLPDNTVIDQVGMSNTTVYGEGTRLSALTGNQNRSYLRNPNGTDGVCHDNNNNQTDFVLLNPSDPQNSTSPFTPCAAPTATPTATETLTPTATPEWQLRVIINEVAWGGTRADDTLAQWIELYNPGPDINLTGLYLRIPGKGDIPLSGSLVSGGYYLIERNETDTSVPASLVIAFPFLNPAGDSLLLYAPGDILIDSANADGGVWPAGSRFYDYRSMERRQPYALASDSTWASFDGVTFASDRAGNPINGSPGSANSFGATSTPTFTPSPTMTPSPTPTPTVTPTLTLTPTRTLTATAGASMAIVINEVAWAGTLANANHEWIELYNPGILDVNLTGWRLVATDNSLNITLSGTIPAGGYFLLERSTDTAVSDIPADQIYTGGLANEGRALQLLSPSNQVIDTANGNGGDWPAGSASPSYCSMERRASAGVTLPDSDFAWITNTGVLKNGKDASNNDICGTPKNINWAFYVTPTPTPLRTATRTPAPIRSSTPTPNRATPEPIVINEFLPHARADYNGDGVIDSGDEFIEIINLGGVAVNLSNYRLDDRQGDSNPFSIGNVILQPGTRIAFFTSETGILLSNGGDSVRLFKPNGQIADAFTYGLVKEQDRAWCRFPDGRFIPAGRSNWTFGCKPSPGAANELASTEKIGMEERPLFCRSPRLPWSIFLSECDRLGLWNWNNTEPPIPLLPAWLEAEGILFFFE